MMSNGKFHHYTSLLSNLYTLQQDGILTDVEIIVEDTTFAAHRAVLASLSQYFLAMFSGTMMEASSPVVSIKGIRRQEFAALLKYVYTGELHLTHDNCVDVITSASYLQIDSALRECTAYLKANLTMTNYQSAIDIAELCNLHDLKQFAFDYVSRNLMTQVGQIESLSPELLEYALKQDLPIDSDESWLLVSVYSWFNHKYEERLPYASKILEHIRFAEIPLQSRDGLLEDLKSISFRPTLLAMISQRLEEVEEEEEEDKEAGFARQRGMKAAIVRIGGITAEGTSADISYSPIGEHCWRKMSQLPATAQWDYGVAVLDNHLYVAGGCFEDAANLKSVHANCFRFAPVCGKWRQLPPMATDRCELTLSALGGKLFAVGGSTKAGAAATRTAEVYDTVTCTWTPLEPLPEARRRHAAVALTVQGQQLLFVSGGISRDSVIASMCVFNVLTCTWTGCAPLLAPRTDHVMFAYRKKIYVCGGWYRGARAECIKVPTIDAYDIATNTWRHVTTVPTPRYHSSAVVFAGKIYVIGGFCRSFEFRKQSAVECYDIRTDTWCTDAKNAQHCWEHTNAVLYVPKFR